MNVIRHKGYAATIEFDADDLILTGRIAGIDDVIGFHASTPEELVTAFHEAVDDYIRTCTRIGKTPERAFSGKVMLRVDPRVHANVARAAELSGKSINQWGEQALDEAARKMLPI